MKGKPSFKSEFFRSNLDNYLLIDVDISENTPASSNARKLHNLLSDLMKTDEQKDSAFLVFFAHQNDQRNYNSLKKDKHYSNNFNVSLSEFDFFPDGAGGYKGEMYEALASFITDNPHIKKINILLAGTGGQLLSAKAFDEFLREHCKLEINIYVFGFVGSALAMLALSAHNFYVRKGERYKAHASSSIGKLDTQMPLWVLNDSAHCLDVDKAKQISLEKLLAAHIDNIAPDKQAHFRKKIVDSGHGYLLVNPFWEYWKKEFENLIDANQDKRDALDMLNVFIDRNFVDDMFDTYEYFREKIDSKGVDITALLTSPTSDLMAARNFGKGVFHHGSKMYSYDFDKIGFEPEEIPQKPPVGSFFAILEDINLLCKSFIELDDVKKVFVLAGGQSAAKIMIGTEKVPDSDEIKTIDDCFAQIEHLKKMIGTPEHIAFRGQSQDYGNIVPSVFRTPNYIANIIANIQYEDKRYEDAQKHCVDIFDEAGSVFSKNVSLSTPHNISKQQHYGLPTRFTDLSTCPLVSLYMACSDASKKDYIEFEELASVNPEYTRRTSCLSKHDGVIFAFPFQKSDYDSLFDHQKALFLSHLVKLPKEGKDTLFSVANICMRYNKLIKHYLDYIYRAVHICPEKNFLKKDFGGIYASNSENPYLKSLTTLQEKIYAIESNDTGILEADLNCIKSGICQVLESLKDGMDTFVEDDDKAYNPMLVASYLKGFYSDLDNGFYEIIRETLYNKGILEILFGDISGVDSLRDLVYAKIIFELGSESLFVPDYSLAANARLIKQKGMFLVSGCEGKIDTKLYYKLVVDSGSKEDILNKLRDKKELEKITRTCPNKNVRCTAAHECFKDGISFKSVYNDLYGHGRHVEKCHDFMTTCEVCESKGTIHTCKWDSLECKQKTTVV